MKDPRYSTAAWQKTRRYILARDGHICQIQGPRCTGAATTVHHVIPSSQAPELFWAEENLRAACSRCNYGGGATIAAQNRRQELERLHALVWEQQQTIDNLLDRLRRYEPVAASRTSTRRRTPAIR